MIWLRRFLAIILALVFFALFVAALLITQVSATFGNPQFYIKQLRQADIYNFLYDELLPAALDEMDPDLGPDMPQFDIPRMKGKALAVARETVPPDWLQDQVEQTISSAMPYFLGDTEAFTVTIPLKDRVEAAAQSLRANLLEEQAFVLVYDPVVAFAVDQGISNLDKLPYRLTLTREELDSSLRTLLPPEWLLAQANASLDAVVPYVTRDAEGFSITVPLQDRVEAARTVAIRILSKPETYDFIMDEVLAPAVLENVGQSVPLPFGISLTQDEVLLAVKEVLPQPWLAARLEDLVNQGAFYLEGRSDTISLNLPLAEPKAAALRVLSDLADRKFRSFFDSLPLCTPEDVLRGVLTDGVPACRPPGLSYAEAKAALGIDPAGEVGRLIGSSLPDSWNFTEADLRQVVGEDSWSTVVKARERVMNGFTFTDLDLKERLGEEDIADLEEARDWIASGFTFNEQDLIGALRDTAEGSGEDPAQQLEDARRALGQARRWLWAIWVLPGLLLALVGLLGGRNWASKLAWGAVPLLLASAMAFILTGPVYSSVARPEVQSGLAEMVMEVEEGVARLAADKAVSMALSVADAFLSGLRSKALVALVLAVVALAAAVFLGRRHSPSPRG